ncbi:hemolysin family protein [Embleya sp. NBC_00896]|uniref:hemolysin family protein n=1 Tax=Embleya sp. NBC_00896 TaxID=2975961 RepID=UPI00386D0698|nr:hemolysin family protein [Embleya sp. NBC_00896]
MGDFLISLVLLATNAFFVGAEFSVISARRTRIAPQAEAGSRRARMVLTAMSSLSTMLAAAQLGITVASLGLGAVAEPALAHAIVHPIEAIGLPAGAVHPIAFVLALAVVVFCHMVLGEMVPKNIALAGPEECALWLAPPLLLFARLTAPILWLLNHVANLFLLAFRVQPVDEVRSVYTAEELPAVLAESREHDLLDVGEHERLSGVLALHSSPAESVMQPWTDVVALPRPVSAAALEEAAVRTGLSRFPVLDEADRPVGYVHVLDVLAPAKDGSVPVYPLVTVGPDTTLTTLLGRMRGSRTHLVLVGPPDAEPLGLVTLDDVMSSLFP